MIRSITTDKNVDICINLFDSQQDGYLVTVINTVTNAESICLFPTLSACRALFATLSMFENCEDIYESVLSRIELVDSIEKGFDDSSMEKRVEITFVKDADLGIPKELLFTSGEILMNGTAYKMLCFKKGEDCIFTLIKTDKDEEICSYFVSRNHLQNMVLNNTELSCSDDLGKIMASIIPNLALHNVDGQSKMAMYLVIFFIIISVFFLK